MAKNVTPKQKGEKLGTWKPFLTLARITKLPYLWLFLSLLLNLFGAQISLLFPDATAKVVAGDTSMGAILYMVGIMLASNIVGAVQGLIGSTTKSKVTLAFRKSVLKKTLSLPVPYFDRNMANRLITRNTEDPAKLAEFFGGTIPYLPSGIYTFFGTFIILFSYNWRLVILAALMIPVVILTSFLDGRVRYKWNSRIRSRIAELGGYLSEILSNIPLVKVFVKENAEDQRGQKHINELCKIKKQYVVARSGVFFLQQSHPTIQMIIAVLGGVYLIHQGYIDVPAWIAFYLYSDKLIMVYGVIANLWSITKDAQGCAERISKLAAEPSEDQGGSAQMDDKPGNLAFENVTFRYDENVVLNNVSITFPQGKTTALVGPSGAGKSTVFGLLERFYLPESGKITLGGRDAKEYNLAGWRQAIGYVPQSSPLFAGSIRDNITYGLDRTVSDEELVRAAKDANIYDYVQSLPDGFDTQVGERGGKLSGGQRQRVAIARALLKDPKILLLDEATSNLDAEAAAEVQKALDRLKAGRTTIMVSHGISAVQDADQIIVLDAGTVSAQGDDETLERESPLYRSLKELQSGKAVLGKA